jgi:hypothetical protein
VHEVAQGLVPSCRVVYVDNDPIVLAHARAMLTSSPEGRTAYIQADLREPENILDDPVTRQTLDFTQPIALVLVAVLHFVPDSDGPLRIVDMLLGALPSGSYLVASHVTPEHDPMGVGGLERTYQASGLPAQARVAGDFAEVAFRGLDLVDPGLVLVSEWRPDAEGERPPASEVNWYGAIARKP